MIKRFTIIGGGSAYAPGLCDTLIRCHERLCLEEVRLQDIDARRLSIVHALCERLARHHAVPIAFSATTDVVEAVRGADAVLNSSRPGGFEGRRLDETLPLAFAMPGQETVGPGGFLFALRSAPAALQLYDAMREHAPDAVLLNYTNPTNIVTQALYGRPGPRVLGLCDQADEDLSALASALGKPGAATAFRCVGLNHATWYTDVTIDGDPLRLPAAPLVPPAGLDEEHRLRFALSEQLARRYSGFWPNSYLPYYQAPARFVEHSLTSGPRTDVIVTGLEAYYRHFEEVSTAPEPVLKHSRGSAGFGDLAVRTLAALGGDEPTPLVLNVVNEGASPLFAADTVVEAIVEVSRHGVSRRRCPLPPAAEQPLLLALERYQRMAATAAASANFQLACAALAENPLVGDIARATSLLDRAREAYGPRVTMFA
jgi:6-phospho-beta-glucosidase